MSEVFLATLQQSQSQLKHYLESELDAIAVNSVSLLAAMRHGLLLGGKRIRPHLIYSVGALTQTQSKLLNPVAAAIESIHAYSLIHDDLPAMDDDNLRRGQPTCHIAFDEASAILAGDALQSFAFEQLCTVDLPAAKNLDLIRCLSQAAGYRGMCGGQALDIEATDQHVTIEQLQAIHSAKTGALISAAVEMGAITAGIDNIEHRKALHQYGQSIGLAFQVQDDILDITSDTQTLGKPQGSDTDANKATYPALLGLENAKLKAQQLHQKALQALDELPYDCENLRSLADYVVNRTH
ncbi:(2E,6E)-farnesyl diphosphate synthase [Alginatibacterium sediminis]|uniref:(2E,6E)-farnesyl diphosphate synthase n=1 Tax=Alginatibacterium sediminis TaxID=2164068 RepID=A0A420ED34_9ALTE|nr:farnesyl diphosphate synthase [Alginatibacterium sediminis]RKF18581.1 (2E,6E)-farnesyl diphosphate synthase [Alginatibacterium sediminis]